MHVVIFEHAKQFEIKLIQVLQIPPSSNLPFMHTKQVNIEPGITIIHVEQSESRLVHKTHAPKFYIKAGKH